MKSKNSHYVKVITPWGTKTSYMLSNDLQHAIRYDEKHHIDKVDLTGALINVPIFELEWQKNYHPVIIPCLVLEEFDLSEVNTWRTRSQFVTQDNLDWNSKDQLRYLRHNYSNFNQKLIETTYKFWKSIICP